MNVASQFSSVYQILERAQKIDSCTHLVLDATGRLRRSQIRVFLNDATRSEDVR